MARKTLQPISFPESSMDIGELLSYLMRYQLQGLDDKKLTPYQEYMIARQKREDARRIDKEKRTEARQDKADEERKYSHVKQNGLYQALHFENGVLTPVGEPVKIFPEEMPDSDRRNALKIAEAHASNPLLNRKESYSKFISDVERLWSGEDYYNDILKSGDAYFSASYDQLQIIKHLNNYKSVSTSLGLEQDNVSYYTKQVTNLENRLSKISELKDLIGIALAPKGSDKARYYQMALDEAAKGEEVGEQARQLELYKGYASEPILKKIHKLETDRNFIESGMRIEELGKNHDEAYNNVQNYYKDMNLDAQLNTIMSLINGEQRKDMFGSYYTKDKQGVYIENPLVQMAQQSLTGSYTGYWNELSKEFGYDQQKNTYGRINFWDNFQNNMTEETVEGE